MAADSRFRFVDAGAVDNRSLGLAIGEQLREPIRGQSDKALEHLLRHVDQTTLEELARAIWTRSLQTFPDYVEELEGMAAGAAVDFRRMMLTFCEESVMNTVRGGCTTVAFAGDGCVLLGHNEDWAPGYEDSLYVVRATLPDGVAFLSLAYIGSLPGSSVAVNSHGIGFSGNALIGTHQAGLAKNLILRSQVEARDLADFERRATVTPRAVPNNAMAIDRDGAMVDIELGLEERALLHGDGSVLIHTNHILAPELQHLDKVSRPCSASRFATATEMAAARPLSFELMTDILRSHKGWPHSVCLHASSDDYDDSQSVASAIIDLADLSLAVANGPPCRHAYRKFQLAAWPGPRHSRPSVRSRQRPGSPRSAAIAPSGVAPARKK